MYIIDYIAYIDYIACVGYIIYDYIIVIQLYMYIQ